MNMGFMGNGKIIKYASRFLLAAVMVVALLGVMPVPAKAQDEEEYDPEQINLELGGSGSTSWSYDDIKPCASGTEEVILHNSGVLDGYVFIWVDNIVSGENLDPEPETDTDITNGGELDDHMLFDLYTDPPGLITTTVSLPATINDLPHSFNVSNYIYFPLNSGDTVNLYWYWELPCDTGNDAQGDTLSFDITYYLLDELPFTPTPTPTPTPPPGGGGGGGEGGVDECYCIVDMLGEKTVVAVGCCSNKALDYYLAYDAEKKHFLEITEGMELICRECSGCYCYPKVIVMSLAPETPVVPEGMAIVGPAYDFTGYRDFSREVECPLGTYFDPPLVMQISYDPALLLPGATNPVIGFFDDIQGIWVTLPPDTGRVAEEGVATGVTNYFASTFAILVNVPGETTPEIPVSPEAARFVISNLNITSSVREIWQPVTFITKEGEKVTITVNVANTGGQEGTYTAVLKIDGEQIDSQQVTLGAGQSQLVRFTVTGMEAGQYTALVAGLSGEFTVLQTINWWLIISIIAALILIGWLVWYFRFHKKKLKPAPAS